MEILLSIVVVADVTGLATYLYRLDFPFDWFILAKKHLNFRFSIK
jgi:hypothetical protein